MTYFTGKPRSLCAAPGCFNELTGDGVYIKTYFAPLCDSCAREVFEEDPQATLEEI